MVLSLKAMFGDNLWITLIGGLEAIGAVILVLIVFGLLTMFRNKHDDGPLTQTKRERE